jgi:hypothetical protein
MHSGSDEKTTFNLFDSAGVGIVGIGGQNRILQVNDSLLRYLDIEREKIVGREIETLQEGIFSNSFWDAIAGERPFYCLVPGTNHLLLTICREYTGKENGGIRKILLLRPYGLEREFIRMRSRLSQNAVLEISSRLSSVAIAGEIILQPELQEDETTRRRFLSSFFKDITDLSELFNELQEIAEPIPFPNRIHFAPIDWKGLVSDLILKMTGLTNERNLSMASELPSALPSPRGDYHWLYLALFTMIDHAVNSASPLSEVRVSGSGGESRLETVVEYTGEEEAESQEWPPPTLFPLADGETRIGKMALTDLALSRSIFLLHGGSVDREESGQDRRLRIELPL